MKSSHFHLRRSLLIAVFSVWIVCGHRAGAQPLSLGCLHAITVGPGAIPFEACPPADPLKLANDPDILALMRALGIEARKVEFRGCRKSRFSVTPVLGPGGKYIVTYPTEAARTYIAPITHELAHVVQIDMAGGLAPLRDALGSKRIELAADYLTGILFVSSLRNIDVSQFQHNLSLMGAYIELDADAHGTPAQRIGSFRFGLRFNFDTVGRDIRRASNHFQAEVYGHIVQF